MVINAVIQPVQVRIGGQDFTENLVQASVYRSGVVFNGILHWQCELTFNVKPTGPIYLDDRNNPSLKRGSPIDITYAGITRRLRVDKAFYDPIRYQLRVDGIDILELFSYRSPADPDLNNYTDQVSLSCGQVPESIEYKTVSYTIRQLLVYAGIPDDAISNLPVTEEVTFYLDKDSNQSYIEMAAEIAAGFLYWMEVTNDEKIVFHKFIEPSISIFYRQNHLLEFKRIEPLLEDPEIICVTGVKKRIVLPKKNFTFSSTERDIADDEVAGTRSIENTIKRAISNYNPCNRYSSWMLRNIVSPNFSVRPKNGRGSYISEVLDISASGLGGTPDYQENSQLDQQTFSSPEPSENSEDGVAFRWQSSLSPTGRGTGRKASQKFYRWNQDNLLETTFEITGEWREYLENDLDGRLKQATTTVSGEAVNTRYIYDQDTKLLKQVQIYSIRGVADITESHDNEEEPKEYKTKSRIEKERVVNIVDFIDNNTTGIKRTSVEGERFVREVVFEGNEDLPREDGSEYVTVSERQASSDTFFEYIENIPSGEKRPPLTNETEEIIEAEYERTANIDYLPRKKEIKINWAFGRDQLLEIAAWFSRYYVYKQNEYEVAVALEPRLWQLEGFVGCVVLGLYGIIDSISFTWSAEGSSECSFRLLGTRYSRESIESYPEPVYYTPPTRRLSIHPIPDYSLYLREQTWIPIVLHNGVGPFQLVATGLPPGFSLDADGRLIVGTVSNTGTYSVTVTATDLGDGNYSTSVSFSLLLRDLPSSVPFVPPTGKLSMASGAQMGLSFLNYARNSLQIFRLGLASASTLRIRSRLNVFGLASGAALNIETRITARAIRLNSGSAIKLASLGYTKFLASGHALDLEQARTVRFVAGSTGKAFFGMTTLRMISGAVLTIEGGARNEEFDILEAQSMGIEVGYIEQQVYD